MAESRLPFNRWLLSDALTRMLRCAARPSVRLKMNEPDSYQLLGKFVVTFQHLEDCVKDVISLLVQAKDEEMTRILMNELDNSARLRTVDVLFQRFTSVRTGDFRKENSEFHKLITDLQKLGSRRNDIVHSNYHDWTNADGAQGLLRRNSKLRGSRGEREQAEEELLPEQLWKDLGDLNNAYGRLEKYRLKIIDWVYPVE